MGTPSHAHPHRRHPGNYGNTPPPHMVTSQVLDHDLNRGQMIIQCADVAAAGPAEEVGDRWCWLLDYTNMSSRLRGRDREEEKGVEREEGDSCISVCSDSHRNQMPYVSSDSQIHTHTTINKWREGGSERQMEADRWRQTDKSRGEGDLRHPLTGLLVLDCNLYNPDSPDVSPWWQDAMCCNTDHTNLLSTPGCCTAPKWKQCWSHIEIYSS